MTELATNRVVEAKSVAASGLAWALGIALMTQAGFSKADTPKAQSSAGTLVAEAAVPSASNATTSGAASTVLNASATPEPTPVAMLPLAEARANVGRFFEQSSNVVCAESVTQIILGKDGKPVYREESKFDYQLQSTMAGGALKLRESRDTRKQAFRDASRTMLITKGFASLLLIVNSQFEASYEFSAAGEETAGGDTLAKYDFKPVAGGSSPAALSLRDKNYPLPLSGSVWVDKKTGSIVRLTAAVDSSLNDLGLKGMQSDIHYALVQFHNPDEAYWMPVSATIELETPMQHWRNVHRFTAYRRFRASIEIENTKESKP